MSRQNKTRKVATYPDGTRIVIQKVSGIYGYEWKEGRSCKYMPDAIRAAELLGATVTTEPNPSYTTAREVTLTIDNFGEFISRWM